MRVSRKANVRSHRRHKRNGLRYSPLAAEGVLDRARWSWLEELESGHYFDGERLALYLLKLRILERRARFVKDLGSARFEELVRSGGDCQIRMDIL